MATVFASNNTHMVSSFDFDDLSGIFRRLVTVSGGLALAELVEEVRVVATRHAFRLFWELFISLFDQHVLARPVLPKLRSFTVQHGRRGRQCRLFVDAASWHGAIARYLDFHEHRGSKSGLNVYGTLRVEPTECNDASLLIRFCDPSGPWTALNRMVCVCVLTRRRRFTFHGHY